jgi:hypothetical protein
MRLTAEIIYPGADPETVFTMLVTHEFQERKCLATGAVSYDIEIAAGDDGTASIITHRTLPTHQVPDFVRRFAGQALQIVERTEWDAADGQGVREGTLEVEIAGAPVRLSGRLRLAPDGEGSVSRVEGELKASVPLLGGKIERATEPAVRGAIRAEQRAADEWLAAR